MTSGHELRTRILVEGTPQSCRIAILEKGHLVEYFPAASEGTSTCVGDVYLGRISKLAPGVEAAFVDIGFETDAFLPRSEWPPDGLNAGQTVVVQVQKDPIGGKGARITTRLALAGRYLVFLPEGGKVRISKRIQDEAERERLESLGDSLVEEADGLIMRTASVGLEREELEGDVEQLVLCHRQIRAKARVSPVPSRLFREPPPAARVVRDHLTPEVEAVVVSSQELMEELKSAAFSTPPELLGRVRVESSPFASSNVERELERALHPRVYLRSGGHVVIEPTEALVSVDVNSGGSKGGADLETTAFRTNLEAAEVIAQQIRLRDLGGILVVDFIDLIEEEHRDQVREAFEGHLLRDKGNPKVHGWADLGLMILSRRRRRMPLFRMLTTECGQCHGTGRVDGPGRVVERAARASRAYLEKNPGRRAVVRLSPDLIPRLRPELGDLYGRVEVKGDRSMGSHRFRVDPADP